VHDDEAGRAAGKKWAKQLWEAGAGKRDWVNFYGLVRRDGRPVNDLADFATQLDPEYPPSTRILGDLGRPNLTQIQSPKAEIDEIDPSSERRLRPKITHGSVFT